MYFLLVDCCSPMLNSMQSGRRNLLCDWIKGFIHPVWHKIKVNNIRLVSCMYVSVQPKSAEEVTWYKKYTATGKTWDMTLETAERSTGWWFVLILSPMWLKRLSTTWLYFNYWKLNYNLILPVSVRCTNFVLVSHADSFMDSNQYKKMFERTEFLEHEQNYLS